MAHDKPIDTHLHLWNLSRPDRPYPWTPDPHPVEAVLPLLDSSGIAMAVQVTPSIMGFDNEYGLKVAGTTGSRFLLVGSFDPLAPEPERRLRAFLALPNAVGVRILVWGDNAPALAAPELRPFWTAAQSSRALVSVFAPGELAHLIPVLEEHPSLRLIIDHMGLAVYPGSSNVFCDFPLLRRLSAFPNVWAKISCVPEASSKVFPFKDLHENIAQVYEWFGDERVVWGSHYPVVLQACSYEESRTYLLECTALTAKMLQATLIDNPRRLLPRWTRVSTAGPAQAGFNVHDSGPRNRQAIRDSEDSP